MMERGRDSSTCAVEWNTSQERTRNVHLRHGIDLPLARYCTVACWCDVKDQRGREGVLLHGADVFFFNTLLSSRHSLTSTVTVSDSPRLSPFARLILLSTRSSGSFTLRAALLAQSLTSCAERSLDRSTPITIFIDTVIAYGSAIQTAQQALIHPDETQPCATSYYVFKPPPHSGQSSVPHALHPGHQNGIPHVLETK